MRDIKFYIKNDVAFLVEFLLPIRVFAVKLIESVTESEMIYFL